MKNFIIISILLIFPITAFSEDYEKKAKQSLSILSWYVSQNILNRLNLTENQIIKINDIRNKAKKAVITPGAKLATLEMDLEDALFENNFNRAKVTQIFNKINYTRNKILSITLNAKLDILALLTPKQKAELKKIKIQKDIMGAKYIKNKGTPGTKPKAKQSVKPKSKQAKPKQATPQQSKQQQEKSK